MTMASYFAESWPVLGALALVFIIVVGATRPYIKKDAERTRRSENEND